MRIARILMVLLMAGVCSGLPKMMTAQEEDLNDTERELQSLYMNYLSTEGYSPVVDKDGDVKFKYEGRVYFIIVTEKDPEFFQLILPGIWSIENEKERIQVLTAADHTNAKTKAAKIHTVNNNVWVSIEFFMVSREEFKGTFKRNLSALNGGLKNFAIKMQELKE